MTIRDLILAKAAEKALHDGVAVTIVHLHGAANDLVGEIAREKDALIAAFRPVVIPPAEPEVETPIAAGAEEPPAEPAAPDPRPAEASGDPADQQVMV
jgi:hypothetical protein